MSGTVRVLGVLKNGLEVSLQGGLQRPWSLAIFLAPSFGIQR